MWHPKINFLSPTKHSLCNAASEIQDTWDEQRHFLCVCMCVSSVGCRLRSAWATDFANKVKQIWTTPLKALHCIFHQRAICRQTEGGNDLGTDIFTEGPIMKARFQQTRSCLTASAQFKFSRHPFRIWIVYLWWKDGMLKSSRMTVTLKASRYYSGAHHAFSRTWRGYP
jgi:hypothetical protein